MVNNRGSMSIRLPKIFFINFCAQLFYGNIDLKLKILIQGPI